MKVESTQEGSTLHFEPDEIMCIYAGLRTARMTWTEWMDKPNMAKEHYKSCGQLLQVCQELMPKMEKIVGVLDGLTPQTDERLN